MHYLRDMQGFAKFLTHPGLRALKDIASISNFSSRNGITSTHLGFIKRGQVIILCFVVSHDKSIQTEVADMTFAVSENKPCIIVVCHSPADTQHPTPFPAMIQTTGYSSPALEATAALIFGEQARAQPDRLPGSSSNLRQPGTWPVEQWNMARDISSTLQLWSDCVSDQFFLDEKTLASVLHRPGYAKHYVTRDPSSGEVLGFCATYLSYVNKEGEKLIGSIAILITRSTSRHRGIGLSLHNHAISQLKKTRGVVRVQLGSTFPRILYGPPSDMHFPDEWFCRRGWHLDRNTPGQGQAVYDLILSFSDWRYQKDARSVSPTFRSCTQAEMGNVLEIVQKTTFQEARMGWFDQYASLMNTPNVKDVVIGIEDDVIVAAALTYTPCCGSQIASNLPWAGRIADDMGGVCCICINRECFPFGCHAPGSRTFVKDLPNSSVAHKLAAENREKIIGGLLDACLVNLKSQGMEKMFIDGVVEALDTYTQLGKV